MSRDQSIVIALRDQSGDGEPLTAHVSADECGVFIRLEGYGTAGYEDNHADSWIIGVELFDGTPRVFLYPDISADQAEVIELGGASLDNRPSSEKGQSHDA